MGASVAPLGQENYVLISVLWPETELQLFDGFFEGKKTIKIVTSIVDKLLLVYWEHATLQSGMDGLTTQSTVPPHGKVIKFRIYKFLCGVSKSPPKYSGFISHSKNILGS